MTISSKPLGLIAVISLVALASCIRMPMTPDQMVAQCKEEVNPGGTYEYDEGTAIPVMRPVEDGTESGARAFNACIAQKARDSGLISMSTSTGATGNICPDGAATIYGGSTYCIGN